MAHRETLTEAFRLTNAQLERLRMDDVDGYLQHLDAYVEACGAVSKLPDGALSDEDARLFARVAELNRMLVAENERWLAGARSRLAALRRSQALNGAYGPADQADALRSQSA